jgi:energy-coupling factor transporter ATP-binding protein EcfA2
MSNQPTSFNPAFLSKDDQELLKHFGDKAFVGHRKMREVLEAVVNPILSPVGASMLFLVGPTGVGKSTMLRLIVRTVQEQLQEQMVADPSCIPIGMEPAVSQGATFRWRDFFERVLTGMHEPYIRDKIDYDAPGVSINKDGKIKINRKQATEYILRSATEKCFIHRHTRAFLIDEAPHIGEVAQARHLEAQLNTLKCLSIHSNTLLVLAGTYDLNEMIQLNGQLGRRGPVVHFSTYNHESTEDMQEFSNVIATFQQLIPDYIPIDEKLDLVSEVEMLYTFSLGCVGTLKEWLGRAMRKSMIDGSRRKMAKRHLEKTKLSMNVLSQMRSEIEEGQAKFREDDAKAAALQSFFFPKENQPAPSANGTNTTRRPGERKPQRDPVGNE